MSVEPHEFAVDPDSRRCRVCGSGYHCPICNLPCSMMGHWGQDSDGSYYTCQEPERKEAAQAKWLAEHEAKERAELARLKAKYPDA